MRHHPNSHVFNFKDSIKLPEEWLQPAESSWMDELFDGDFIRLQERIDAFKKDLLAGLTEATRVAEKLPSMVSKRDHDLYLVFKGKDKLTRLNISLERVYPKLPESGEQALGDAKLDLADWAEESAICQTNVQRIISVMQQTNRMIAQNRMMVPTHPKLLESYNEEVKTQLLAASHFMKRIYGFDTKHGLELIEEVAGDVLRKLTAKGGNIGLDLNEWVVWEYHDDGSKPSKVEDEELNFVTNLYNRYTVSFVDALYAYLMTVQSPYIRPYAHREVVTEDDGIAIGTIRQVK